MVTIRSANELIESLKEFFRLNQPDLDTKPGTVARDLFIEGPASQIALVYNELSKVSDLQSISVSSGQDLNDIAANYGATRKVSVPSSGVALLTFSSIPAAIPIIKGGIVYSSSGTSFAAQSSVAVSPTYLNLYKAIATKYKNDLDFLGITDPYAIEVPVTALTPGLVGNISKYSLTRTAIAGVSNVTNVTAFFGGSNAEDDATFRNRVLAIFSGSNVGTALGYQNAVTTDSQVLDAVVIQPGDPLMQRDGTQVSKNADGTFTIISEGQGGKVDIIILGLRAAEYVDSFIYRDVSNKNDPTNIKNVFVLGQITGDENKTVNRRRIDNLASGTLPAQPVDSIVEVTGSLSGSNFEPKSVDSLGRVTGNYELIKDTGVYAGSPFAFDKFHWISDRISLLEEDLIKGKSNGQDSVNFTDVISISAAKQNISISNENSSVSNTDRSSITLLHTPCSSVTRVFNLTTGERYTVTAQNPDGAGTVNTAGRIVISGNTLPSPSDTLQVDYVWLVDYDPYLDYDGRFLKNNIRTVQDSVDWGYSNVVRSESVTFALNGLSSLYLGSTTHPINSVVSVNQYLKTSGTVALVESGIFVNKLAVTVQALAVPITSVASVCIKNTVKEVFVTAQNDGSFSSTQVILGGVPKFTLQIILPTDSAALAGDVVDITYNEADVFTVSNVTGNFNGKQITIPVGNYSSGPSTFTAKVNYIADVQDLATLKITELPLTKSGNGFAKSGAPVSSLSILSSSYIKEFQTVVGNNSSATLTLSASNTEFLMTAADIASVVRLSDGHELWNVAQTGTVSVSTSGKYVLNLDGYSSPAADQSALVLYTARDVNRTQPMTFNTSILSTNVTVVQSSDSGYYVALSSPPTGVGLTQISVIRISDGVDLMDLQATLDTVGNTLTFSSTVQATVSAGQKVLVVFFKNEPMRQGITRIAATLSDQANSTGIITIKGTSCTKASEIIFTAINSGLTQNVSEAVRIFYGLDSSTQLSNTLSCARLVKLERVNMIGDEVIDVDTAYDVDKSKISNAMFFPNEIIEDKTLDTLDFTLSSTTHNVANQPVIGDKLRATFYVADSAASEDLLFTRNGTVYGNTFFAAINKVVVSSGFTVNSNGKITLSSFNQPVSGTRYKAVYDYLAPKLSERIVVKTSYNRLIGDATIALETQRPINADVLIKSAEAIAINVSMAIIVKAEYLSSATVVAQNVKDQIILAINTNTLGDVIDSSDVLNVAYSVAGVDRVRITQFNIDQALGQVLSITAQKNQYFTSNLVSVTVESR